MNKRKKKSTEKKSPIYTFAIILLVCFLGAYLIYQAVLVSKKDMETQIAFKETVYTSINTKGFVVRDESFLKDTTSGTKVSFVKNGERVGAGDTVSTVFASSTDAEAYLKISELKKNIKHYEELSGQVGHQIININSFDEKINSELINFMSSVDNRDFKNAVFEADTFRDSLTGKQIAVGEELDFSKQLNSLEKELDKLENKKYSYVEIKSDNSGYFINGADGYENVIDFKDINELTVSDIEEALKSEPKAVGDDVIGRCVSAFEWYIACVVPTDETVDLSLGKTLEINIPYEGIERLPVTLYKIGERENKKTELILKCDLMNESLADLRIEDIEIITNEHTGYKISNSAIRTVDNVKGVYTLRGNITVFKKIHIVYSNDEFSLVNTPQGEKGYLLPYDKVITKGVELENEKLI